MIVLLSGVNFYILLIQLSIRIDDIYLAFWSSTFENFFEKRDYAQVATSIRFTLDTLNPNPSHLTSIGSKQLFPPSSK